MFRLLGIITAFIMVARAYLKSAELIENETERYRMSDAEGKVAGVLPFGDKVGVVYDEVRFRFKVGKAYFSKVVVGGKEDNDEYNQTIFARYVNFAIGNELMVVDDRMGCYVYTYMPFPFHIPADIYWSIKNMIDNGS